MKIEINLGDVYPCSICGKSKPIMQITTHEKKTEVYCSNVCWEQHLLNVHPDKKGR